MTAAVVFMAGLIRSRLAQTFLIIAPVSVLPAWIRELEAHLEPYIQTKVIIDLMSSEMKPKQRQKVLEVAKTTMASHIIVTSYQLVTNMIADMERVNFDYVILDEGCIVVAFIVTFVQSNTNMSICVHTCT